jgi:hypothetical protein
MNKKDYEEFVLVQADKACNNIVFVCKAHFYNCILNELGINSTFGDPTYIVHPNCSLKKMCLFIATRT